MNKIELHVHLDGSVRIETVAEIKGISIEEARKNMVAKNSNSLNDYLTKFDYPLDCMQDIDNIKRISFELTQDLINDGVVYAEVRFAPILHQKNDLKLEEVIDAVLEGTKSDKIIINIILCMMRGFSFDDNKKIIDLFNYNKRIVGLDLAGAEAIYPNELYKDLFEIINQRKIPFTIHSGEALGYESVDSAIKLNAKRIGHGIRSVENEETIDLLIKNNVMLEVCPTSNVDTFSVDKYENHPIYELYKRGVKISINTDDRTVSNITLEKEYEKLKEYFKFTDEDFKKINIDSLNSSFIDEKDKNKIIKNCKRLHKLTIFKKVSKSKQNKQFSIKC